MFGGENYIMKKSSKPTWRISQQKAIALLGGKEQPGGGVAPCYPGDGITGDFLAEHKYTSKPYFLLKKGDLNKIIKEALPMGKEPVLTFEVKGEFYYMRMAKFTEEYYPYRFTLKSSFKIDPTQLVPCIFLFNEEYWVLRELHATK